MDRCVEYMLMWRGRLPVIIVLADFLLLWMVSLDSFVNIAAADIAIVGEKNGVKGLEVSDR